MTVSVPEKTIEHWTSQYIAYRFKTKPLVWWPAVGEDIRINRLRPELTKAVQLEVKTTTIINGGHRVQVDLGQLWSYTQRRSLWERPFYVFPIPDWTGELIAAARATGLEAAECAYSRVGNDWWFAEWMWVLPCDDVEEVLKEELNAHGSSTRGARATLVEVRPNASTGPTLAWGHSGSATAPVIYQWREFWRLIDECGLPEWPQLIRVPDGPGQTGPPGQITRDAAIGGRDAIRDAMRDDPQAFAADELSWYGAVDGGTFQLIDNGDPDVAWEVDPDPPEPGTPDPDADTEPPEPRKVVAWF